MIQVYEGNGVDPATEPELTVPWTGLVFTMTAVGPDGLRMSAVEPNVNAFRAALFAKLVELNFPNAIRQTDMAIRSLLNMAPSLRGDDMYCYPFPITNGSMVTVSVRR